jgi:hypothetical protein
MRNPLKDIVDLYNVYFIHQIYISLNGKQCGPYTLVEIREQLIDGLITKDNWAWYEGCSEWVTISSVLEIASQFTKTDECCETTPVITKNKTLKVVSYGCLGVTIALAVLTIFLISWGLSSCQEKNRVEDAKMDEKYKSDLKKFNIPHNDPTNESVWQVKDYLKKNLKDPGSYQSMEWSSVRKLENGTYMVAHKYRARNSFGAYTIEQRVFILAADGRVIESDK